MAPERLLIDKHRTREYSYDAFAQPVELLRELHSLRLQELFTDIKVCVDGGVYNCHKVILVASSPYFKAWFQHQDGALNKEHIALDNITAAGFAPILEYFYTAELHFTVENMADVLEAAEFLQLRHVAEKCCQMMLQHITVATCLSFQQIGEGHLYTPLAEAAREYAICHFSDVATTTDFLYLSFDQLREFLIDQRLYVNDEAKLSTGLVAWIEYDRSREEFKQSLMKLTHCVSFSEVSQPEEEPLSEHSGKTSQSLTCEQKRPVMLVCPTTVCSKNKADMNCVYYYDFTLDKWERLTNLPFSNRSLFGVTRINNNILITGGEHGDRAFNEAVLYSIDNDQWEEEAPMLQARCNHSTVSTRGKVYAVGGAGPISNLLRKDSEVFDPKTGQWTMLPELLDVEGIGHCALVPLDGKLYAFGGTQSYFNETTGDIRKKQYNKTQFYDLDKELWVLAQSDKGLLGSSFNMSLGVGDGDALYYNGFIMIFDEQKGRAIKLYNPITDTMNKFIHTHSQHRFGGYVIFDETLYCSGGLTQQLVPNDMMHCLSLRDHGEKTLPGWKMLASFPFSISHHAAFVVFKPKF